MMADVEQSASAAAIRDAALRVFGREELQRMPKPQLRTLAHLIGKRLDQPGAPPTQDELKGLKELVTGDLWDSALNRFELR